MEEVHEATRYLKVMLMANRMHVDDGTSWLRRI